MEEEEGLNMIKSKGQVAPTAKYCVTGATGYIGSWLVVALLKRGCTVHARDHGQYPNGLIPFSSFTHFSFVIQTSTRERIGIKFFF